jgi:hypothetical protein
MNICLLTNSKLVKTPRNVTINDEVASWNKSPLIDSSLLPSMMFEDNVGEDGLSAHLSYTIDINDSNYIDNLASHPAMFDNKVPIGDDTLIRYAFS